MRNKNSRLDAIKLIISTQDIRNQDELSAELGKAGFDVTQATLSRDLKQLKVAKASSSNGSYVYVLPNNTMYRRVMDAQPIGEAIMHTGFVSIKFSGNLAVLKTRPGYASRLAYDIDASNSDDILGTVAGDDTILLVLRQETDTMQVMHELRAIIPDMQQ